MKLQARIFIGIMGALCPLLLNLLVVDYDLIFANATTPKVIGYVVKIIVLSGIGSFFTCFLYVSEINALKLFQYALGAPALILSFSNGHNLDARQQKIPSEEQSQLHTSVTKNSFSFFSSAYAQDPVMKKNVASSNFQFKKFDNQNSAKSDFEQGLLGTQPENVYFVFDSRFLHPADALKRASELNLAQSSYEAQVYLPYQYDRYYYVVLGANLTYSTAIELRSDLIETGISMNATLWTFPTEDQHQEQKALYLSKTAK